MNTKVLFIDEKETFISRAIMENLRSHKYDVEFAPADFSKVSKIEEIPDIIFLNVEENFARDNMDLCVYLKDISVEGDKMIFISGYHADIDEVLTIIPEKVVGGTIERPVNTKTVADIIDKKVANGGEVFNKKHILVVDDSGEFLRAIKGWLSNRYNVAMVNSAANAIAYLATNTPDLILLDYEMPVCSGPQLLEMIRAESKTSSIPVIFLTSKSDRESVQSVLALHPQGYLLKTLTPERIIDSVDEFFQKKKGI